MGPRANRAIRLYNLKLRGYFDPISLRIMHEDEQIIPGSVPPWAPLDRQTHGCKVIAPIADAIPVR